MLRTAARLVARASGAPVASTSRAFATHVVESPFEAPSFPKASSRQATTSPKNPYIVPAPVERPKAPRHSSKSSRVRGRTPNRVRKSISETPLAEDTVDENGKVVKADRKHAPSTVGQVEIFLPSVFVRLVRNTGQHANDPYTATFRTDLRLTKPDISNYLKNIYDLSITSIRTINYLSPMKRSPIGGGYSRGGGTKNYKKVLVTLTEPFWYPEERGREWCNDHFSREKMESLRDKRMLRIGDGQKYGVSSNRYRGAGKLRKEVDRLREAHVRVSEEIEKGETSESVDEADKGMSSMRKPEGLRMKKNVMRSREEKVGEAKTKVEKEMDRLRTAGW